MPETEVEFSFRFCRQLIRTFGGLLCAEVRKDYQFLRSWPTFPERTGYRPHILFPRSFNEKLQWIKLFDRNPVFRIIADKHAVRDFVRDKVGAHVLNELYGCFNSAEEINIDLLPQSFVLKTTHASGWNIICPDKSRLDWPQARSRLRTWLASDYYNLGREWCYKHIPRRIIAERFLRDDRCDSPNDYKFFCFNGKTRYVQVDINRISQHKRLIYTADWVKAPFGITHLDKDNSSCPAPACLDEMLEYAARLSCGFRFMRVDFYEISGRPVFGELTCYPGSGGSPFRPREYDFRLGQLLEL